MNVEYENNLAKDNIALRTQIIELKKNIEELKEQFKSIHINNDFYGMKKRKLLKEVLK